MQHLEELGQGGVVGEAGPETQGGAGRIQQDVLKALRRKALHHDQMSATLQTLLCLEALNSKQSQQNMT